METIINLYNKVEVNASRLAGSWSKMHLKEMHLGGNFDRPLQEKSGLFLLVLYSRQYFVLLSNNLRIFFSFSLYKKIVVFIVAKTTKLTINHNTPSYIILDNKFFCIFEVMRYV